MTECSSNFSAFILLFTRDRQVNKILNCFLCYQTICIVFFGKYVIKFENMGVTNVCGLWALEW